jgi:1-deoxy-D-xylulose-5-phosphate reductoisomerase
MPLFERQLCRVIVLGSTGSIGTQTLEVIEHLNALHQRGEFPTRFEVVGLAAGRCSERYLEQARRFGVRHMAFGILEPGEVAYADDPNSSAKSCVRCGRDAAIDLVLTVECDLVVSAISGSAGLDATLRAVKLGRDVALANKEALVAAGSLIISAARESGARILPIDSEHSGIWQCLASHIPHPTSDTRHPPAPPLTLGPEISRIILTASGGPFRTWPARETYNATPEQALNHPTWKMGPKVTVDSASLTNKALEIIEAHWLFGLPPERIDVLIHPQSIVHAIVEFQDGSSVAQLGAPDMRTPIQYALTFPARAPGACRTLTWSELRSLDFEPPDHDRFPALSLAARVIREGGTAGAVFNAANEGAVEAFLQKRIPFGRITELTAKALDAIPSQPLKGLADALDAQTAARAFIRDHLGR